MNELLSMGILQVNTSGRKLCGLSTYWRGVLYADGCKVDVTITPAAVLPILCEEPHLPPGLDLGYRALVDKDRAAENPDERDGAEHQAAALVGRCPASASR